MQKLPIGIQSFSELRSKGFLYIDKTEQILELIEGSKVYFLSRPRRFGKSLLISTLKEIFSGRKELFKGLFIEDKIEWDSFPVIHLDFAKSNYKEIGLKLALQERLNYQASLYKIELDTQTISSQLEELIRKLYKKYNKQVVLLIDEYDKPIIDFLEKDKIHIAQENSEIMKSFYSPIKSLDNELRFFFLTGISRFTKVSIFSDLNNLNDITTSRLANTLVGYTETEVHHYFDEYIKLIAKEKNSTALELKQEIKEWYNGYSFGGEKLYNPFSILNFMSDRKFNNYWFATGTPTFLIKLMAEEKYYDINDIETNDFSLANFDITDIDPITVLFQTGYLTIREKTGQNMYRLGYPNREVENSMVQLLLSEYVKKNNTKTNTALMKLKRGFETDDLDSVFYYLKSLFADISYQIFEQNRESYYHSIIFLTFKLLGYNADAEVSTSIGRIDAVVKTPTHIYILEFKVNDTAENAIKQIKEKKYAQKYLNENKKIVLIGVACQEKTIKEYLIEDL